MTGPEPFIAGLVEDLVKGDPLLASVLGRTEGLDELPAYSRSAIARRVARAHEAIDDLTPFVTAAPGAAPSAAAADAAVTIQIMRRFLRRFELRRVHENVPALYLETILEALLLVMLRELAPPEERLQAVLRRLGAVPDFLEEAQANLKPGLPRVFVENGIELALGLRELLGTTVTTFARDNGAEGMVDDASIAALEALDAFLADLRRRLLPASADTCAAGRTVLEDLRVHEHMLEERPEEIAAYGRRMLAETQGEMAALAADMGFPTVEAAVSAARDEHPSLDGLVGAYRDAVEDARAFVVSHDLVTLPPGERLAVIPTPPFLQSQLPFAAYEAPGPYSEDQLGYYLVTPPRSGLSPADVDRALRAHPVASLAATGVHEAYPGHHVQLVRANRAPSLARRLTLVYGGCALLTEGWAFYCEEMMERQGLLAAPMLRLMRLNDQAWRACRVVIDAELHTGRMPFEEAVAYLAREARMDPIQAELEVRWYAEAPGEPMSYLLGRREVIDLAKAFSRRRTVSLKTFHDALLDWGSAAPRLIGWGLGLMAAPSAFGDAAAAPAPRV